MENRRGLALCLCALFLFASCSGKKEEKGNGGAAMNIWAHRGCSYAWPENTLEAFGAAAKLPVTGIEFDVQLTKDGRIVVIHDETVDRTTDGSGPVRDFTLSELKKLRIRSRPGFLGLRRWARIPTLEEALDLLGPRCAGGGLRINIELKTGVVRYEGIEEKVLAAVRERGLGPHVVYSSFNPDSIVLIKEKSPEAETAILNSSLKACLDFAGGGHGVGALHPSVKKLDVENVHEKTGLPVRAWGAAEPLHPGRGAPERLDLEALEAYGVTDIFTNVPEYYLR